MRTCKVCGGAVFASNEVSGYSGPICSNPLHQTQIVQFNDNNSLLERIIKLEDEIAKLKSAPKNGAKDEG